MSEKDLRCYSTLHCCDKKNQQMQIKGVNYVEKGILYSLLWFGHMAHMEREQPGVQWTGCKQGVQGFEKGEDGKLQRITIGISS